MATRWQHHRRFHLRCNLFFSLKVVKADLRPKSPLTPSADLYWLVFIHSGVKTETHTHKLHVDLRFIVVRLLRGREPQRPLLLRGRQSGRWRRTTTPLCHRPPAPPPSLCGWSWMSWMSCGPIRKENSQASEKDQRTWHQTTTRGAKRGLSLFNLTGEFK